MTAKEDLESYPSLRHYRNANSKRMTFDDALAEFVHTILEIYDERSSNSDVDNAMSPSSAAGHSTRTRSMKVKDVPLVKVQGIHPRGILKNSMTTRNKGIDQYWRED